MPTISVSASIDIKASPAKTREILSDFNTWPVWSPWLYTEPEASVEYVGQAHQPGHGYSWEGKKTGQGSMSLSSCDDNQVQCDLQFIKPFKSTAKVWFDLSEQSDSSTTVTWNMLSKLPFYLFFMKGMMCAFIRSDYSRGLRLLKDYVETGAVHSNTVTEGVVDVEARQFMGVAATTVTSEMESSMRASFTTLMPAMRAAGVEAAGPAMAQYDKLDVKTNRCEYIAGVITNNASAIDPPVKVREIPACRALKLTHTGRYEHLGNAWSTGMASLRADGIKLSKTVKPFELYINDPDTTDSKDLITELYLPVR